MTDEQFEKYLQELNRKTIGGIDFTTIKYFGELPEDQKIKFYHFCSFIFNSPYWPIIMKEILGNQTIFTTMEAQGILQVIFGRATCQTIHEFNRFLEHYHKLYNVLSSKTKAIDEGEKYKPL